MQVSYSTKVNLKIVFFIVAIGFNVAMFFFSSTKGVDEAQSKDLNSAGLFILSLSLIFLMSAYYWIEVDLHQDRLIFTRNFFNKKYRKEILYEDIKSVDISDYIATIIITDNAGKVTSITSQVRKIRGEVPEIWLDREPLPSVWVKDIHMLRYELQRRAKLI